MRRVRARSIGDGRLRRARVVLPQPRVRREVLAPACVHRERPCRGVDRQRRRSRRVDADADHPVARELSVARCPGERADDGGAQPLDVVSGVLARQVRVPRVQQHAVVPARIVEDGLSHLAAVLARNDDGADGVGAEIDADDEGGTHAGRYPRAPATPRRARRARSPRRARSSRT